MISQILFLFTISSFIHSTTCDPDSCSYMNQYLKQQRDHKFEQKSDKFWEFRQESNTWVQVKLPFDLVSCINDTCKVVNTIQKHEKKEEEEKSSFPVLALRKRVSLTRMSKTSIWVTGLSGSIYERYWNGLQWVIAPHELPVSAGYAVSVFILDHTILALSESGLLYQMQVVEESQPTWVEFMPVFDQDRGEVTEQNLAIQISSGVISDDKERIYFCTKNGSLLELNGIDPPRWTSHGRPPRANVAAIADAASIRPDVIFTLSDAGDLYEYEKTSKPPWKKHLHVKGSEKENSLAPIRGYRLHGPHSASLFLITKGGALAERRLSQRKWKWIVHGNPNGHPLTSITYTSQDEQKSDNPNGLFLTTATGFVFEYRIPKYSAREFSRSRK